MNAADFRIENIQRATLNGRKVKIFTVFARRGDAFVYQGKYSVAAKTASRDLWKIAAERHGAAF